MNIRIRFTKEGDMKYIGHLDMMRYFQKAIRRAGIDVSYSEGFNPHQILSFASPLSLGMTSTGEYFDARVNSSGPSSEMIERLNNVMASGVMVLSWKKLPDEGSHNAMASLTYALYEATSDTEDIWGEWNSFINRESIIIHKKTKKNEVDIDIKPLIINTEINGNTIRLMLAAGSEKSVKVISVLDEYYKFINHGSLASNDFIDGRLNICRVDQYTGKDNIISLDDIGEEI